MISVVSKKAIFDLLRTKNGDKIKMDKFAHSAIVLCRKIFYRLLYVSYLSAKSITSVKAHKL